MSNTKKLQIQRLYNITLAFAFAMRKANSIILLSLLCSVAWCYLQLNLLRYELRESLRNKATTCITKEVDKQMEKQKKQKKAEKQSKKNDQEDEEEEDEDSEKEQIDDDQIEDKQNYREICYEKDISYSLPIYLNDLMSFISLDTTAPISWFKGANCHIEASSKKCTPIRTNIKEKIAKILKKKEAKAQHSSQDYAMIEGSSELVKGIQERGKSFKFMTRDSSRLTNLAQLLLLGFYMKGEKDMVELQNTNFINATEISLNLNYLCDGAISLRFDDMSQNSFLKQLIDYQKTADKYLSIYINNYGEGVVAVGEVASKYTKNGYGGLEWMEVKQDESYGSLPVITDIFIENEGNNMFSQIRDKEYPAVISLSASYIGIPKEVMAEWLKKFNKKSKCAVNEQTKYFQCESIKQKEESKIITFEFSGKKISFTLTELKLGKLKSKTIYNLKQTLHDTYAVLGQPLFQKYFIIFDYGKQRVGFGEKSDRDQKEFINVVTLVRFICLVFLFGCSFILCFLPIKRCLEIIKGKAKFGSGNQNKGETRRLKQYTPIQQNAYEDLSGQIKKALEGESIQ